MRCLAVSLLGLVLSQHALAAPIKVRIDFIEALSPKSFVALIDMKGGIDFQAFLDVPNFKLVSKYAEAEALLIEVINLFEARKELLLLRKKTNWNELSLKELEHEPSMKGRPIGPVVVVVDELAELAKKATERSSKSPLQSQLATLARLARFAGIHLVLGTQRPDKGTLDMQSKDMDGIIYSPSKLEVFASQTSCSTPQV